MFQPVLWFYFFPGKGDLLKLFPAGLVSMSCWPGAGPEQSLVGGCSSAAFFDVQPCTLLFFVVVSCMRSLAMCYPARPAGEN